MVKNVILLMFAIAVISGGYFLFNRFKSTENPSVKLPVALKSVPAYPKAELKKNDAPDDKTVTAVWNSSSNVPTVSSWYLDELKRTGWTIDVAPADTANENVQYLLALKDKQRLQVSVMKNTDEQFTVIVVDLNEATSKEDVEK